MQSFSPILDGNNKARFTMLIDSYLIFYTVNLGINVAIVGLVDKNRFESFRQRALAMKFAGQRDFVEEP